MILVIVPYEDYYKEIKAFLDAKNIPSQFVRSETIARAKISVYTNILKQINAKVGKDLFR